MRTIRLRRLTIRGLCAIHKELIARYGGNSKNVEMAMLELATGRAELVVKGPHWKSRARLAAGYAWRLLVNRPFADGNQRMALAALVVFLEMNGLEWKCGEVEETAMVLRAAAGEMQESEWNAWVVWNVGKKADSPQRHRGREKI